MYKKLVKLNAVLIRILEIVVILIMGSLVLDVVWQVFTRYVLRDPSTWTDELAAMLLIWVSLLGASVGFIRGSHLGVDFFVNKLKTRQREFVELLTYMLIALFALVVLVYGGSWLVSNALLTKQTSAALKLKMGYVYTAVPISGMLILSFTIQMIIERLTAFKGNSQA